MRAADILEQWRAHLTDARRRSPHTVRAYGEAAERLVLFSDGSIDAVGSDSRRAETLMFRLAREERDAWVTWPARAAALMAAELSASRSEATGQQITVEPAAMQKVLEKHVRAHLDELAEVRPDFR